MAKFNLEYHYSYNVLRQGVEKRGKCNKVENKSKHRKYAKTCKRLQNERELWKYAKSGKVVMLTKIHAK